MPLAPPAAYGPIAAAARSPGRQGPQGVHPSTVEVRELRAELEQLAQQYGALHEHGGLIHIQHQDYVGRMEKAVDEFRDEGKLYLMREAVAHENIAAQARAEALQHGETLQIQHEDAIRQTNIATRQHVSHERTRVQQEMEQRFQQEVDRIRADFAAMHQIDIQQLRCQHESTLRDMQEHVALEKPCSQKKPSGW